MTPRLLLLTAALVGSSACAKLEAVEIDGELREYIIDRPSGPGPHPLVFVFHGGGGNARQTRRTTGYAKMADEAGALVVFPQSVGKNWNDGRDAPELQEHIDDVNDLGFVDALIDDLVANEGADPRRIYATGISNGGFMSLRLACERSDRFAAVAPVAASLPEPLAATCRPATSLLLIHGDDDEYVPYEGGPVAPKYGVDRGRALGVPETIELFRSNLGCETAPVVGDEVDAVSDDGTAYVRSRYEGCSTGHDLELVRILGGGHSWPGAGELLDFEVGETTQEFDGADFTWRFFESHRK